MICKYCRSQLQGNEKICPHCGAEIEAERDKDETYDISTRKALEIADSFKKHTEQENSGVKHTGSFLSFGIGLLAGALLLMFIAMLIFSKSCGHPYMTAATMVVLGSVCTALLLPDRFQSMPRIFKIGTAIVAFFVLSSVIVVFRPADYYETHEDESEPSIEVVAEGENGTEEKGKASSETVVVESSEETEPVQGETDNTEAHEMSDDEQLMADLKKIADSNEVAEKAFDILRNQIGFTKVKYIRQPTEGVSNYDFIADGDTSFCMTVSDDVYMVFQPNGGTTFYKEGTVVTTAKEYASVTIPHYDRGTYYSMAQEIVRNSLKDPRSAKFPNIVTDPASIGMSKKDNIVAVSSYVDAKNGFNATIRSEWLVEFEVIDLKAFSYKPIYVNIDGEKAGTYIELE